MSELIEVAAQGALVGFALTVIISCCQKSPRHTINILY